MSTLKEIEKLPVIKLPKNIKFEDNFKGGFGIVFPDNNQTLFMSGTKRKPYYTVAKHMERYIAKGLHLVPTMRGKIKTGDIVFRYGSKSSVDIAVNVDNITYYAVIIDSESYAYVNNSGEVRVSNLEWDYWFKLKSK